VTFAPAAEDDAEGVWPGGDAAAEPDPRNAAAAIHPPALFRIRRRVGIEASWSLDIWEGAKYIVH
jgi:hypothetical protein